MSIKGRIHSIETFGTVDGPGIRYVVFFQGCPLRCQYCHNRDTWNVQGGNEMTVDELIEDIKKYIPFMKSSGGGVTISGGEPTLQLEFLTALLKRLKELKIHTAVDTSGFIHFSNISRVLEYIDLFLLDIKHIDDEMHSRLTGVSNKKILEFAEHLTKQGKDMWIRHVVIPTITDNIQDFERLVQFLKKLSTIKRVDLLPYHSMGKYKWKEMNVPYPLEGIRDATNEDIIPLENILNKYEFNCLK